MNKKEILRLDELHKKKKENTSEECGCDCHRRKPTSEDGVVHDSLCCDKMNGSLLNWGLQKLLKKEKEKSKLEALDIPMGVSVWMNHGRKYGYDKFWKDKIVEETLDIAIDVISKKIAKEATWNGYSYTKKEIKKYLRDNLKKQWSQDLKHN